jgi:hypothetical protein
VSKYLNIRSILRAPLTISSFTPCFECERTTPPISVVICVNTAKLIPPNCAKRNRNLYAFELPSSEQLKQPSASVRPHSQNRQMLELPVLEYIPLLLTGLECSFAICLLKATRNRANFACLRGNTRLPLNSTIRSNTLAISSTTKRLVFAPCWITRPNLKKNIFKNL